MCVCEKGQHVIREKEKKVNIKLFTGLSVYWKMHFSRPQWHFLNTRIFQPAQNIIYLFLKHDAYHTDFRMDANGVTPIPAPIHIMTLYLNTSWKKTMFNIATVVLICMYRTTKPIKTSLYLFEQKWRAISARRIADFEIITEWFTRYCTYSAWCTKRSIYSQPRKEKT